MFKKLCLGVILSFFFLSGVPLVAQDNPRKKPENRPMYSITLNIKFKIKEAKKPADKDTKIISSEAQSKEEYEIESISLDEILKEQSYPKGTSFSITLKKLMPGDPPSSFKVIGYAELVSTYLVELVSEESKLAELPVRTGAYPPPTGIREVPDNVTCKYLCILKESGKKYNLKITKYNSFEDKQKDKDSGVTIFQKDFITNHRYYVGLDVGCFFPFKATGKSYTLFYKDPSADPATAKRTLEEKTSYQPKGIVYVSIFPVGFEPEGSELSWRRVHFNIGTELSKSILEKFYLGIGYDFNFFSANLSLGIGNEDSLPGEYQNWIGKEIPNTKIDSIPFVKKNRVRLGFAISLPFNFASTIGKIIGL